MMFFKSFGLEKDCVDDVFLSQLCMKDSNEAKVLAI